MTSHLILELLSLTLSISLSFAKRVSFNIPAEHQTKLDAREEAIAKLAQIIDANKNLLEALRAPSPLVRTEKLTHPALADAKVAIVAAQGQGIEAELAEVKKVIEILSADRSACTNKGTFKVDDEFMEKATDATIGIAELQRKVKELAPSAKVKKLKIAEENRAKEKENAEAKERAKSKENAKGRKAQSVRNRRSSIRRGPRT